MTGDATGRLVVIGAAGYQVWHTAQTAADADTWTPWTKLAKVPGPDDAADGEKLGVPAVGFNHAGLIEIFVVDQTGGELYQLQATASGQPPSVPKPSHSHNSHDGNHGGGSGIAMGRQQQGGEPNGCRG